MTQQTFLTQFQKTMLSDDLEKPTSNKHHHLIAIALTGELSVSLLEQALFNIMAKHPALRSRISHDHLYLLWDDQPQAFLKHNKENWPLIKLDARTLGNSSSYEVIDIAKQMKSDFFNLPFHFTEGPLWRVLVIQTSVNQYQLCFLFHHIIIDGQSINIFLKDLSAIYNQLLNNPDNTPYPNEISIKHSVPCLSEQEKSERLDYWRDKFTDYKAFSVYHDQQIKTNEKNGKRFYFPLSEELSQALLTFSKHNHFTIHTILVGCWYALLTRHSNETDICIGITSSNRRHLNLTDADKMINCFMNTIPFRLNVEATISFNELFALITKQIKENLAYQLSLDEIIKVNPTAQSSNLYHTLLVYNNERPTLTLDNIEASQPVETDLERCKLDMYGINIDRVGNIFNGFIEYNPTLFAENTISHLISHYLHLLQAVIDKPEYQLLSIPLLTEKELILLTSFTNKKGNQITNTFIDDIVEQTALHPNDDALIFHDKDGSIKKLTYAALHSLSSNLANYLLTLTDKQPLGMSLSRSLNTFIVFLAALKANIPIVPLEYKIGQEAMIIYKIKNANIKHIVVDNHTTELLEACEQINVNLMNVENLLLSSNETNHIFSPLNLTQIAYIIYTSGTTSIHPKGVIISHNNLISLYRSLKEMLCDKKLSVLGTAPHTFDAWLFDWLVSVATGGALHFAHEEGRIEKNILEHIIREYHINYLVLLPELLSQLDLTHFQGTLICMGSTLSNEMLSKMLEPLEKKALIKFITYFIAYGVTEATIANSFYLCDLKTRLSNIIGQPLNNTQMLIVDRHHQLCPFNVVGELYLGGGAVGQGYLNNESLSKEKFIYLKKDKNNFQYHVCEHTDPDAHYFYKSGDLCRYIMLDDDKIAVQFLGRKDRQLKINGVRLQIDSIEEILSRHALIERVIIIENTEKTVSSLQAYIIFKEPNQLSSREIRGLLNEHLNRHRVPKPGCPNKYIVCGKFPLTANGKVDTKQLRYMGEVILDDNPFPPETPQQKALVKCWKIVLGREVGNIKEDTFSELGGDSMRILRLGECIANDAEANPNNYKNNEVKKLLSFDMTIVSLENKLKISAYSSSHSMFAKTTANTPSLSEVLKNKISYREWKKAFK